MESAENQENEGNQSEGEQNVSDDEGNASENEGNVSESEGHASESDGHASENEWKASDNEINSGNDDTVKGLNEGESSMCPPDVVEDKEEDEEGESSNVEYVDSPESEDDYEDVPKSEKSKGFEFSNINSPEGNSAMEGELDFEDEVVEPKPEICKDALDDVSKEELEEDDTQTEDQAKVKQNVEGELEDDDDEEGQCSSPVRTKDPNKEEGSVEEGEDDGEISDDDDLEEGEVKDTNASSKQQSKQVCRFFLRGQCTWGNLCRFLHLSTGDKGNYNMFAPSFRSSPPFCPPVNNMGMMPPHHMGRGGPRDYHPPPPPPPPLPPPPPINEPTPAESSWERGLRHAKELMKKATRRKENEPDFEDKRLNLSLDDNDQFIPEFEKENDFYGKVPFMLLKYDDDEMYDNGEREARDRWRVGRFENFEVRWTRQDVQKGQRDNKNRPPKKGKRSPDQEKRTEKGNKFRDDRLNEVQSMRPRADEWRDPWRRSKTPKGRRSRSRGRSRGSYSSVSSHSYSERSSRSSYSYSRSTSRSSFYSSRSPSLNKSQQKRKVLPRRDGCPPTKTDNRPPFKKKGLVLRRTQSRSYSRSRSSRSVSHSRTLSSRSRSLSRTPSVSRSHSYSRSLSMDSVSSASSSVSRASNHAVPQRNRNAQPPLPPKKVEVTKPVVTPKPKPEASKTGASSLLEEMQRLKQYDRMKKNEKATAAALAKKAPPVLASVPTVPPIVPKKVEPTPPAASTTPPNSQPVAVSPPIPSQEEEVQKEAPKQGLQKPQIKLTLLSKNLPSKLPNPLKKDSEAAKSKIHEKEEKTPAKTSLKRPLSPPRGASAKRSTSSRRDELLKQLKAVEDAIARKRSKIV